MRIPLGGAGRALTVRDALVPLPQVLSSSAGATRADLGCWRLLPLLGGHLEQYDCS